MHPATDRRPLLAAGLLLGAGLGGFFDGIVFHQLLQVHSMLSARVDRSTVAGLEVNMFWDGVFHAGTWAMTVAGLALLWRAVLRGVPRSTATLLGAASLGWGSFNLIEGVINHHVLHVHHVTEAENHLVWDLAFLASGAALALLGWVLIRAGGAGAKGE
jgi:uncharacterized membrane protein